MTCRSWDEGVLTDVCLTGVLTDLCLTLYIFIISLSFLLRMRNVSDKRCGGNQNTHVVFSNFFFPENHAVMRKCGKVL